MLRDVLIIIQMLLFFFSSTIGYKGRTITMTLSRDISEAISNAIGIPFTGQILGGFGNNGGGTSTGTIIDKATQNEFFFKSTNLMGYSMLNGEFEGILTISKTSTIKVPTPICIGTSDSSSFLVFEKLALGGYGSASTYASQLAKLHQITSPTGKFGFHVNNTIGATFQPNQWTDSWPDFWDEQRLGHMLSLARRDGADFPYEKELRLKTKQILSSHSVTPNLIHGDLWSGNQGYTTDGCPVIYDCSAYYGDHECDLAMTRLFGSNSQAFYETYDQAIPPKEGRNLRQLIYNSYHLLNHFVLFGGGYLQQAHNMFAKILKA